MAHNYSRNQRYRPKLRLPRLCLISSSAPSFYQHHDDHESNDQRPQPGGDCVEHAHRHDAGIFDIKDAIKREVDTHANQWATTLSIGPGTLTCKVDRSIPIDKTKWGGDIDPKYPCEWGRSEVPMVTMIFLPRSLNFCVWLLPGVSHVLHGALRPHCSVHTSPACDMYL